MCYYDVVFPRGFLELLKSIGIKKTYVHFHAKLKSFAVY